MGQGVMYAGQVVKIECLKVKFECLKVKFEWLKGQRSFQHPEDIRVNGCTPREYLGLQSTRILVGFGRVAAASSARSVHARGGSHGICYVVESLGRTGYCARSEVVHCAC